MTCAQARPLFSPYLDGAVTGRQMRDLSCHLEACDPCRHHYISLRRTQQILARVGPRKAPADLALKLQVAISQEAAQSRRRYLDGAQVRLQNALNVFMVPATAGLSAAVVIFVVLMGFMAPLQADTHVAQRFAGGEVYPIDYANACPDVALTSLHYYFPWAMKALVKWTVFALVTGRQARLDLETDRYFAIADEPGMSYGEKLGEYRKLADAYFETERYQDFCATSLARLDQLVLDWVTGPDFDQLLVRTVQAVYPEHEHDQFIAHLRGLTGLWADNEGSRLRS